MKFLLAIFGIAGFRYNKNALPLVGDTKDEIDKSIAKFAGTVPQWGAIYNPSDEALIYAVQDVLAQVQGTKTSGDTLDAKYEAARQKLSNIVGKASPAAPKYTNTHWERA